MQYDEAVLRLTLAWESGCSRPSVHS